MNGLALCFPGRVKKRHAGELSSLDGNVEACIDERR